MMRAGGVPPIPRILLIVALAIGLLDRGATGAETLLSLDQSVQIALEHNHTLAVEREKVREVETGIAESRGGFRPQIDASATYTRLDVAPYISLKGLPVPGTGGASRVEIGDDDNYALALSARQALYTSGKLRNGAGAAEAAAEAQQYRFRQARADLVLAVEKAYYGLLKARRIQKVARDAVALMEAHVSDVENLHRAGMAARNDVLKARVQLANVRVMDLKADNGVKLAGVALCNLLGLPLDSDVIPQTPLRKSVEDEPRPPLPLAIRAGWKQRPELAALERSVRAAERRVAVARGQRRPDLFLSGNYTLKRPDRENEPDFYRSWAMTLAAQWPVFDGGIRAARVDRARAQLAQMRQRVAAVRDEIALEITRAYLNLAEARQRAQATAENATRAQENFRVTRERFEQGVVTSTDLLDAETLLTQARVDRAAAVADYQTDRAALRRAMGVPWDRTTWTGD